MTIGRFGITISSAVSLCLAAACSPEAKDYSESAFSQGFQCAASGSEYVIMSPKSEITEAIPYRVGKRDPRSRADIHLPNGNHVHIFATDSNKDGLIDRITMNGSMTDPQIIADLVGQSMRVHSKFASPRCRSKSVMTLTSSQYGITDIYRARYCERKRWCSIEPGDTCSNPGLPSGISGYAMIGKKESVIEITDYKSTKFFSNTIDGESCSPFGGK